MSASLKDWRTALNSCFRSRLRPADCRPALLRLHDKTPIPGIDIIRVVTQLADLDTPWHDPLLNLYLVALLDARLATTADILEAFSRYTSLADPRTISPLVLTSVLELLCRCYVQGAGPSDAKEARRHLASLQTWLTACTTQDWTDVSDHHHKKYSPRDQLAILAVNILDNHHVKQYLSNRLNDTAIQAFASLVNAFTAFLANASPASMALPRLSALVKAPPLCKITREMIRGMSAPELAALVTDLPVNTSRAGLYIYLNALLAHPPLVDDKTIFARLVGRFGANLQGLVVDLVVAAFDVHTVHDSLYVQSFIANKLPLVLLSLSSQLYPPDTIEPLIRMALGRLDANTFAQDSGRDLRQTRNEFVTACFQHRMIPYAYAFEAMGAQPKAVFCQKDALVTACSGNTQQVEKLVRDLDRLDGNAGQVAAALVEVVRHLCSSRDTSSLKSVAMAMTKRLVSMDVVFQYMPIEALLQPLTDLLTTWVHDDDQSEYQPAYEEFSVVLLFAVALSNRYGRRYDGVVNNIMTTARSAVPVSSMSPAQNKNMSMWVKGMFATDERGESSGISDDVLSQCSPLDFYLLVPTLFDQGLLACGTKALPLKTFLGGLEFFLEPFLLPSQIGVMLWISSQNWQNRKDTSIMLQVLNKLLLPASISGDAQTMHEAMLTIVAGPLTTALMRIKGLGKDVNEMLDVLKPGLSQPRPDMTVSEVEALASSGWPRVVRDMVAQLVSWVSQVGMSSAPPQYSHRAFHMAVKLAGPTQIAHALIEEVAQQTSLGLGPTALEVAEAFCSAPRTQRILSQTLQALTSDAKKMLHTEPGKFEAAVRLHRLIEQRTNGAQTLPLQSTLEAAAAVAALPPLDIAAASDQSIVQDAMNLASATTAATAEFPMSIDAAAAEIVAAANADPTSAVASANDLQLGLTDNFFGGTQAIDFSLDTLQAPAMTFGGDDDIFAGLELDPAGDDVDFGF